MFTKSTTEHTLFGHSSVTFCLRERYALFHLRWFLLLETSKATTGVNRTLDIAKFNELYFSGTSEGWNWFYGTGEPFLREDRMIGHPETMLFLLNSWQYNGLDAPEPRAFYGDWYGDARSCLIPLHDDLCCRRRDGPPEHVAACTILTMIAHLLRASESDRNELLDDHWEQYSLLWDHGLSFVDWEVTFKMDGPDIHRAPSEEFLTVLTEAGLDGWLQPNSDLNANPSKNTALGRFLAMTPDDILPPVTFADLLRSLVRHVDVGAVPMITAPRVPKLNSPSLPNIAQEEFVLFDPPIAARGRGRFDLDAVVVESARDALQSKPAVSVATDSTDAHVSVVEDDETMSAGRR